MAKSDITFPSLRIIKKVRGYKSAVDGMIRETGLEFFNEYIMPMAERNFQKFRWHGNLEKGLIVKIRKNGEIYKFILDSNTENDEGVKYYKEVITGKPKRKVKYSRLKQWVIDKIDPAEDELHDVVRYIRGNIAKKGSRPKPWVLINIKNESDGLVNSELKTLLQRKMKSLRRRYPKG